MYDQDYHEMRCTACYSSGVEEWSCPTCGRRLLLQWPPHYKKIVLDVGDALAIHRGSRGQGLVEIDGGQAQQQPGAALDDVASGAIPMDGLLPWRRWLQRAGLERHWDDERA